MKKKQLLLGLGLWLLFNGCATLIRFWAQAMGLYPDPSVNRSADAHGEAWGRGYLTGCSRTDPFQVGAAENVPAAGGYVFHQLTLFDVVGHHLVAQQRRWRLLVGWRGAGREYHQEYAELILVALASPPGNIVMN